MTYIFAQHGDVLAQSRKLGQLGLMLNQMNRSLAPAAIAHARIIVHFFQRFPALCAPALQMALFDRDAQGDSAFFYGCGDQAEDSTSAGRQVRTRCTSYPDQRDWNVWRA